MVKIDRISEFQLKPLFLCRPLWRHWYLKMWNLLRIFWCMWKICRVMSTHSNAHAKVKILTFNVRFSENRFDLGIILIEFWTSIIWSIQIHFSFADFKNYKNPGIQPSHWPILFGRKLPFSNRIYLWNENFFYHEMVF